MYFGARLDDELFAFMSQPETREHLRMVLINDHRCALCGIRILTPEGHTIVEAAHIVPWSESRDDRPTNGLALCRFCHWSFGEGLMSVGASYEGWGPTKASG